MQMARDDPINQAKLGKDGRRKPQRDVERFGKSPVSAVGKRW